MFRVGKSNKPEPAEQPQRPETPHPPQTQPQPPPPSQQRPAEAQATRPAPVGVPAPAADDTVERARAAAQQAQTEATARAVSETDALARGIKEGGVGGFVGGTSKLSGEVRFRGMMRVDGHISGQIVSEDGTLIVSSGGRVDAEVSVAVAKINGTVAGNISATEKIELGRTARVEGDLDTPALVVEQGAIFDGGCRMRAADAPAARSKNAA